ncbi:iron-containing alcohol dehydrogenase family protein [Saccharicrinis aurantiacus]|uniref:iron-containing alcohol dehydrogenase family protein n=1 Tax=Saccharicrinis aurantiacus TaxID=1849719 RepID=UPI00083953F5|nr:iron-containing alcohol dehydrogenase family protein [Saccharicrinis aurantiacus]
MLYDFRSFVNPGKYAFGKGSINHLGELIDKQKNEKNNWSVFIIDNYFSGKPLMSKIPSTEDDLIIWIDTSEEPKTTFVNSYRDLILAHDSYLPATIVGIGGGTTMDYAKAVGLMVTNPGDSADFQGLDLIKNEGIYTICVPTVSGTGAEVSMTAVLSGPEKKLGIKCDYTIPNEVVFDPEILASVPTNQRFYTGMDCYIHNAESLNGTWITEMGKAFAEKSNELCKEVFLNKDMDRLVADEKMMVASIMGGNSITYAQVGVCHALSYGLAVVLKVHHGVGNCIVFNQLEKYYPNEYKEFKEMQTLHGVTIPEGITKECTETELDQMVEVSWALEHMWNNAFGPEWEKHITKDMIKDLFRKM